MSMMVNMPYDELEVGSSASFSKTLTEADLVMFAAVSGDLNPVHLDESFAKETMFKGRIGHGMWTAGVISATLATVIPGPGTIYLSQDLKFKRPVRLNDEVTATLTVTDKKDKNKQVILDCKVVNQEGTVVAVGEAKVIAPTEKLEIERPELPKITIG